MNGPEERPELHVIDIFMMSVKCGNCDRYQTIVDFRPEGEKNVYTYECDFDASPGCDANVTRTIVEIPRHLDNSTRRAEELPYYSAEEPEPDAGARAPEITSGRNLRARKSRAKAGLPRF